ncbi:RnfABCDGE type electron transport complex subunit D [Gottfriedia acidiceleris]|uniref:RnfABCDGE type electron transport complex subunit D n=1 Tax=Gottfriedia acidiceleris TaxID=371036 RepID=A0ABY4JSF8_9BACI|nr:RnfABCDGE type electron transport complex subunit D [Gottfriedia acidiceleris]UPM56346.1 RnfABCDGE type electron transport complex subunit D [Gottfriedia acidiceleris]
MTIKQWIKSPKGYVILSLMILLLIATIDYQTSRGAINCMIAVFVGTITDILCALILKRKNIKPYGAVITGIIVAMILSTTTAWYVIVITTFVSILSKYLIVFKRKQIFNPAVFGLLMSIILFHTEQSWWGAFGDLQGWTIIFLLMIGYIVVSRVNKFPMVFSFLGTYFMLLILTQFFHIGDASDAFRSPFINASLFFAFFMLTDPPTSPAKDKQQVIFGFICALVGVTIYSLFGGLTYLFTGLMAGNLFNLLKSKPSIQKVQTKESIFS